MMQAPTRYPVAVCVLALVFASAVIAGCTPDASDSTVPAAAEDDAHFARVTIEPADAHDGEQVWMACRACHFEPEPGFEPDRLWLEQLKVTTCFSFTQALPIPQDRQRVALARYLISTEVSALPIRTPADAADPDPGFVQLPCPSAWVVLRRMGSAPAGSTAPRVVRCYWPEGDPTGTVAIAPATYAVTCYGVDRVVGTDRWSFCASGLSEERYAIAAGKTTPLPLDFSVRCEATATIWPDEVELSVDMRVNDSQGLTLLHNGTKPVPGWRLFLLGDEIAHGTLEYG